MQQQKLTILAILTLTILLGMSFQSSHLASANYAPPPSIEIFSPIPVPGVHSTASIPLQIRVNVLTNEADITSIRYSLDGGINITLANLTKENGLYYWTTTKGVFMQGNAFSAKASLENVSEGTHTLTVYSYAANGVEMAKKREFTVDYNYIPPQLPPFNFPNGTLTTPTITVQTQTPNPTTNTASLHLAEKPLLYITIACVSVLLSLFVAVLYFKKKPRSTIGQEVEKSYFKA